MMLLIVCVCRLVYRAAVWYANHLQISGEHPTIVIISDTPQVSGTPKVTLAHNCKIGVV